MKNLKIPAIMTFAILTFSILTFAILTGCNSSIYEIIEVEETVEIKEEPKQETTITEIKEDTKPSENKFSEKNIISRSYVIQIGAFNIEENAERFINSAKKKLSENELTLKNIDGLYKIRFGNFSSLDEAIKYLNTTIAAGFGDSFVVELTYIKQENK